ncbi:MAG: aminotransferase class V-fold PLP-dependent enzyme [Candidatus Hydrogenedentes bacterium]|nr:aminotransferase class V-fold PLP-dependent enzyme [Candidatus Hydrogenedentota bacterium]
MAIVEKSGPVDLEQKLHPYRGKFSSYTQLPKSGRDRADILEEMRKVVALEENRWREGYASGSVYHGDKEHIDFLNEVYALNSQSNQLHADLWPSAFKYEAEIVSMTAHMLNGGSPDAPVGSENGVCGCVSSGGTESIMLAMKTYRDWGRAVKGITQPEMVLPISAHPAFDKAAQYFCIKQVKVPIDDSFRADVNAMAAAITPNTIVMIGSAPNFPYGTIDPIVELAAAAQKHGVGFHTDSCLGGFLLPWAEKLGYPVPAFDFRVPGVTSMSCDTHKYGYAAKGTSVVLYRGMELRRYQYFTTSDWPGGLYHSPTFAGSRPGGLSAACWASMVSMGEEGYLRAVMSILSAVDTMKKGIQSIPELQLMGESVGVFAFGSNGVNAYELLDAMSARSWALTGLQHPAGIHVSPTLRHAQPGVAERFVSDLREAVAQVKANPNPDGGMAPIYGLATTVPDRRVVHDLLKSFMDMYYQV